MSATVVFLFTAVGVALALAVSGADDGSSRRRPGLAFPGLRVGIVANALDDDAPRIARRLRAAGVGWMREEFRWSLIEPEDGEFTFRRYDGLMASLASRGRHVLPVLIETPPWLARERYALPPSLTDWQDFVRHTVRRYGPGGAFWREHPELDERLAPAAWEVWNEPYYPQYSSPKPDPAGYARLVRATTLAGREIDPSLTILAAGETAYPGGDGTERNWTRDLFDADPDLGDYFDAFAVHPYSVFGPRNAQVRLGRRFGRFTGIDAELTDLGIGLKPFWITELGWSTCRSRTMCVSEAQQGRYLRDAFALVASTYRDRVQAVFTYRLDDLRGDAGNQQIGFGLVRRNGRPKPAYAALRRAAADSR